MLKHTVSKVVEREYGSKNVMILGLPNVELWRKRAARIGGCSQFDFRGYWCETKNCGGEKIHPLRARNFSSSSVVSNEVFGGESDCEEAHAA